MKKILLTTFIALGFGFASIAQESPAKVKINKQAVAEKKAEQAQRLKSKHAERESQYIKAKPETDAQKASKKIVQH